jgi:hypothetical protein
MSNAHWDQWVREQLQKRMDEDREDLERRLKNADPETAKALKGFAQLSENKINNFRKAVVDPRAALKKSINEVFEK